MSHRVDGRHRVSCSRGAFCCCIGALSDRACKSLQPGCVHLCPFHCLAFAAQSHWLRNTVSIKRFVLQPTVPAHHRQQTRPDPHFEFGATEVLCHKPGQQNWHNLLNKIAGSKMPAGPLPGVFRQSSSKLGVASVRLFDSCAVRVTSGSFGAV